MSSTISFAWTWHCYSFTLSPHPGLKGLVYKNIGLLLAQCEFQTNDKWFISIRFFQTLWEILALTNYLLFIWTLNVTEYSAFFFWQPYPCIPSLPWVLSSQRINKWGYIQYHSSLTCFNLSGNLADESRTVSFFVEAQEQRGSCLGWDVRASQKPHPHLTNCGSSSSRVFSSQFAVLCLPRSAVNTVPALLKGRENITICIYSLQITACNHLLLNKDTWTIFGVLN